MSWIVHKFGGTSVANAERLRAVEATVEKQGPGNQAIVVSAMSGVTDALIELVELAKKRQSYEEQVHALKDKHLKAIQELLPPGGQGALLKVLESDFKDVSDMLRGVSLAQSYSETVLELITGFGELWLAQMLGAYLRSKKNTAGWLDAREVLVVEPGDLAPRVDWEASREGLKKWLARPQHKNISLLVITGFIASTREGIPTTLKRNGSDFSASIFAALLDAESLTIWKEVDGIMSANPKLVPEAVVLEELSYQEATELAYFGAKVIHPSTMAPAIEKNIPIYIRNSFNTDAPGTKIHARARSRFAIKGLSTVDRVALINVEGTGMIGVPGVASRLFTALKEVGVSVILISQASSEHSICFAVPTHQAHLAKASLEKAFFAELHHRQIQTIEIVENCSILAAVGDNMVEQKGIAARFCGALSKVGVNIRAIAQGSSERNISVVVNSHDAGRALRAVHAGFYLSNHTISVGLVGPGLIGSTFLNQLKERAQVLRERYKIDLRLRGVCNSKKMALDAQQIPFSDWKSVFATASQPLDLDVFAQHIQAEHLPHSVIIDCTTSEDVARRYPLWLKMGIHVITPNKKANSGPLEFYESLHRAAFETQSHFLYEANVGAGLPVINTLKDLIQTGDEILQIEGVFSGTLSFLFNSFSASQPFSAVLQEAKDKGYTEPDPRDDLSGMDVARKLIILAREMGLRLELSDIAVENLVPEKLRHVSVDEYLSQLAMHDERMTKLLQDAQARGEVLRYVGTIDPKGKSRVELKSFSSNHAFARISGSDNIIAFRTNRYKTQPLIVQGPGAGPEVTAGGVFADLLRLASYLGAPPLTH